MESDRGFTGGVPEGHPEVMHHVQTRLAFSPTLCASEPKQQSGLSRLNAELTNLSFQKAPSGTSYMPNLNSHSRTSTERQGVVIHDRHAAPQGEDSNSFRGREILWPEHIISDFRLNFPKWCPFHPKEGATEYCDPPQNSKEHHLLLRKEAVSVFKRLRDFQVLWIYQELFLFMHRQGRILERTGKVTGMAKSITYSQFTPPWIRLNLAVKLESTAGNNTDIEAYAEMVTLKKAGVTDLRKERNTQGYRRLTFILAAFYNHEERAVKPLLDYLLSVMPSAPSQLRKKPKKLKRSSRNEKANNGSEGQTSDVVEAERIRKKPKATASPNKSGDTRENNERKVRETQEDLSDLPCAERSEQPTTDQRNMPRTERSEQPTTDQRSRPRTEHSEKLTEIPNTTQMNVATPKSMRLEQSYTRTTTIAQTKEGQTRESVFKGHLEGTPHVQDDSEAKDETTDKPEKANSANVDTRKSGNANLTNKETSAPQSTSCPEEPLTPFDDEDIDINLRGGEEESDDALEADILSGPIKCGAVAQCRFFTSLEMQDTKFLTKKCDTCEVLMHQQCYFFRRKECDLCAKKRTFKNIYEHERR